MQICESHETESEQDDEETQDTEAATVVAGDAAHPHPHETGTNTTEDQKEACCFHRHAPFPLYSRIEARPLYPTMTAFTVQSNASVACAATK